MADMVEFSRLLMLDLAEFLQTPPVFYLFSLVCFTFVVKLFQMMMGRR